MPYEELVLAGRMARNTPGWLNLLKLFFFVKNILVTVELNTRNIRAKKKTKGNGKRKKKM